MRGGGYTDAGANTWTHPPPSTPDLNLIVWPSAYTSRRILPKCLLRTLTEMEVDDVSRRGRDTVGEMTAETDVRGGGRGEAADGRR